MSRHPRVPKAMTPQAAITLAAAVLPQARLTPDEVASCIGGLTHASECLKDMFVLLRYIRAQLPDREPELHKLITSQLLKGCNL